MPNIFRTGMLPYTNFKLGRQTEHVDQHQRQAPLPPRSKVKVAMSRDASDRCWPISRKWNVLETPKLVFGRKVIHSTGNNAHQFRSQRQRSRSPVRHNVETGSASYLQNVKAYELQTSCTDRTKTRIAVMDHRQQGKRLRSRWHVVRMTGVV